MKRKTDREEARSSRAHGSSWHPQEADELRKGDVVLVEAGDVDPAATAR